ncbi:hypothetical protein [Gracilibacillus xinjiangensis]|uniref:Uncharacterized protein n=1 Tax=Gracilibacillus xinjiangensis TaxID=1193282 RepID=A0ABV8WYE4_9BACI
MKALLLFRFIKPIYTIVVIMFLVVLTACSSVEDDNASDVQQNNINPVVPEKPKSTESEPTSFENYEEYISYISEVPDFEPYYKTVFAFEELPNGITSVPIEEVKAMYNEMKATFDYVLVNEHSLVHRGNYEGDTSFVEGYEPSQTTDISMESSSPINTVSRDWQGNEILTTPLKTVILGESVSTRFDSSIDEGRNLQVADFTLKSPNEPISVVLGNAYKDIYAIGDIFSLELISEVMDFKVVGFYKSGVGLSKDVGALDHVNFDHTIVMPHFIPDYEPVGEAAVFQHAFLVAELMSGHIRIQKSVEDIEDATYEQTVEIMEEIAERHNLSSLYKVPYWPVGFVW